ncbi:AAA family ATPase [Babesia caballi]|uniref:AAA family ATPase n=1 Tax=Babesia caballi TaxID=5871 RepID=A0AAV4LNJ9_BABCB|nr:AAA family ATPase [Babesia caballi]
MCSHSERNAARKSSPTLGEVGVVQPDEVEVHLPQLQKHSLLGLRLLQELHAAVHAVVKQQALQDVGLDGGEHAAGPGVLLLEAPERRRVVLEAEALLAPGPDVLRRRQAVLLRPKQGLHQIGEPVPRDGDARPGLPPDVGVVRVRFDLRRVSGACSRLPAQRRFRLRF